ncbi:MAG: CotH kinase family protein, partial [Planctomycetota bacterium]
EIGLFDTDGNTLVDSIVFDDQVTDISYGRSPDASDTWRFMGFPTPEAQNNAGYLGQVADTEFSHNRGFYVDDFNVTIVCDTPGATIRYTIDGSAPTVGHGNGYFVAIPIRTTTCLRAVAFKAGYLSSNVDAQTYIFLDDVIQQSNTPAGFPTSWGSAAADYEMDPEIVNPNIDTIKDDLKSIPTMSLVMNLDDLFNPSTDPSIGGIYTTENQWGEGVAWERPGSIELFYPDGSGGFQANCGVRIYGGVGRREKKKTLRLLFKGIYGTTKLRYPLFGPDAADRFDTIILRANFNDAYTWGGNSSQYIRDEYVRQIQLALGDPSAHGTFVHLYINGQYWGLYNPVERPESSFAATYFGGDKDDWDALNSGNPTGESSTTTWNAMLNLVRQGVTTNEAYQRLQGNSPDGTPDPNYVDYLDIDNYINYMLINFFVGNRDWPGHNWYAAMNRVDSTGFKSFSWDAEWVMGMNSGLNENRTGVSNSLCEPYAYLRNNPEFCILFADYAHKAFFNGGPLYVDPDNPQWNPVYPERNRAAAPYAELADVVERAMIGESARWGDVQSSTPYNIGQWRSERDWVLDTYMPDRSDIVLQQLRNANLYPDVNAPEFKINGEYQHGGQVSSGDLLSMIDYTGTTYYTIDGNDPRLPATGAPPGTSTTLVAESAAKRVLIPTSDIGDAWRNGQPFDDSGWNDGTFISGKTGGVGYETGSGYQNYITYDVEAEMFVGGRTSAYIRIPFTFNGDPNDFNFMTLKIRYDDGFVAYLNDDPNELTRRNFTGTPAWNSAASSQHGDSAAVFFENIPVSKHISFLQQGDNILAIHGLNVSNTSTDFLISVELVAGETDPSGILSDSAMEYTTPVTLAESTHVRARTLDGATWSALNEATFAVGPVADNLRITEMMYHPLDTNSPNDPNAEFIELTNIGPET